MCVCVRPEFVAMQVKPTPPPVFHPPGSMSPPTRAHLLRSAANHAAMQQHTDAHPAQTAHGSHAKHPKTKTVRRKSTSPAAVSSHPTESHDVQEDSCGDLSMATATNMQAEDASAKNDVDNAADVHCWGAQDVVDSADMSASLEDASVQEDMFVHLPVEKPSICCCVPDRLVAIHVRSELTESHFDT